MISAIDFMRLDSDCGGCQDAGGKYAEDGPGRERVDEDRAVGVRILLSAPLREVYISELGKTRWASTPPH